MLQDRLKEVAAHEGLRREATRAALEAERQRESSLAKIQEMQGRLNHLESEACRVEVVEKYRNGTLGKVEVALACKAGFDFLIAQFPPNLRLHLERFHYPSQVANCLSALREIEMMGGGFVLDVDNGDDEGEESGQEIGEGSTHESGVSRPEEEDEGEDEEAGSEPRSTPPPTPAVLPLQARLLHLAPMEPQLSHLLRVQPLESSCIPFLL